MTPRHRGGNEQQHHHHHEMDPLLIKEASTLSSKNTKEYEEETVCCGLTTKRQLRKVIPMILGLVACCFVVGIVAWKINNPLEESSSSSSSSSGSPYSSGHHKKKKKSGRKHRNKFFRPTTTPTTTTQQRIESYSDPTNKYGYAEFVVSLPSKKKKDGEGEAEVEFLVHYSEDINIIAPPGNKQVSATPSGAGTTTTTTTTTSQDQDQEEAEADFGSSGSEVVEADKINLDGDGGGKYDDDDDGDDDDATLDTTTAAGAPEDVEEQPSQHFNNNNNRTFGELARILLPPWHMASVIAVDVSILDDTQPSNHTLKQARQVLKIGRDLLDVFSPCYDSSQKKSSKKGSNIWKKLRALYSDGYEQVGYYKDLSAAHLVYDEPLWTQRLDDILAWKEKFLDFDVRHDIIKFMVDGIKDPPPTAIGGGGAGGGFEHKQSHLFWGEELSSSHQLPRSTDPATESFDKLIKTQLQSALQYYDIIVMYDTVLTKEEQEDYHNLRKELRDVVDEFNLLGFGVVLPDPTSSSSTRKAEKSVRKFKLAVHKIGIFHDEWTAYDKYKTNGEHFGKQQKLELSINEKWTDFKAWMFKVDFRGTIEALLEELK